MRGERSEVANCSTTTAASATITATAATFTATDAAAAATATADATVVLLKEMRNLISHRACKVHHTETKMRSLLGV